MLKVIVQFIAPILSEIFNSIIKEAVYPDCLKVANVTPIIKSGNKQDASNYRPISVLSSVNKIFERLLFNRLTSFVECHHILLPNQFGFVANRCISDAFFTLLSTIRQCLDQNKFCSAIFFYFSKAFDTIDHKRLIMKLERYGIGGTASQLL